MIRMPVCPKCDLSFADLESFWDHKKQLQRRMSCSSLYNCVKCCFCDESPEVRDKHMEGCTGNLLEKNEAAGGTMNSEAPNLNASNHNNEGKKMPVIRPRGRMTFATRKIALESDDEGQSSSSDLEDRSCTDRFKCTDCLQTFPSSKDLQDHQQQGSKGFKCKKCCTSFQIPRLYEKHVKKCNGKKARNYISDSDDSDDEVDDNWSDTLSPVLMDKNVGDSDHDGDSPISKPSVSEESNEEEEEEDDDDIRCEDCGKIFQCEADLSHHKAFDKYGHLKCPKCCQTYTRKHHYDKHVKDCDGKLDRQQHENNSAEIPRTRLRNRKVPEAPSTSSGYRQMPSSTPKKITKSLVCPECKRKFEYPGHLHRHRTTETNRGKYKCGKCCSSFVNNGNCLRHRKDCDGKLQLKQSGNNNSKDEVNNVATQGPTNKSSSGSNQPSTSGSAKRTLEEDQTVNRKKSKSDNGSKENHSNMGETNEASSTTTATPIRNDQASPSSSQESTSQRVALQNCNEDDFATVFGTRTIQESEPASNRADPDKDIIAPLDLSQNQPDQNISQADVDASLQQEEIPRPRQCHAFQNNREPSTSDAGGNRSSTVEGDENGVKLFPIKSLLKIWNINDNPKNYDGEIHRILQRLFYDMGPDVMKPEEVIIFLQKKPEKYLGYQIISIVLIDFVRQMDVRAVIDLYNAAVKVRDTISESFLSFIESLIVLKVQSQVNPTSPVYLEIKQMALNLPGPGPVQNRILNGIPGAKMQFLNKGNTSDPIVYDFVKDTEELSNIIRRETFYQWKNEESAKFLAFLFDMEKSWTNRCSYWKEICKDVLKSFTTSVNQKSLIEILLEHSRSHRLGTVAYAKIECGYAVSNTLHLHPEILQRYTNHTEKVAQNDLPKIRASLSDQKIFRYLLYGPRSNLNEAITFAVYEIAKAVKIKEIWKFLFPNGIIFESYNGRNKEDIFQIALCLNQEDALCEIAKVFDQWFPSGCRENCLSYCDEQQLIQFFGRDDIDLNEWEKYQMILYWAHHKCQKKCLPIREIRFDEGVDTHFRKVLVKVLRLKPLQHCYDHIEHHGYIRLHEWQTFFDKQASERWDETGLFSLPPTEMSRTN